MSFVGRWLTQATSIGLSLAAALAAMQLPAMTREYQNALLQVSEAVRHDIAEREDSARRFYHLAAAGDDAVIQALRPFEPSNAEGLRASIDRERNLRAGYARIGGAAPILRPVVAAVDLMEDTKGYKNEVLSVMLANFVPQVAISAAAAFYGLLGLVFGSFLAQLLIAACARLARATAAKTLPT